MTQNQSILFDARLVLEKPTGIGQYIASLLPELIQQAPDTHFHLLRRSDPWHGYSMENWTAPNLTQHTSAIPHMSLSQNLTVPRLARNLDATLIHYPHFDAPVWFGNVPVVATIHDAKYLIQPDSFGRLSYAKRQYMRLCYSRTLNRAKAVAVDSQSTADDLQRLYGRLGANTSVIHLAADPRFQPSSPETVAEVCQQFHLRRPFILSVGELRPHKNAVGLLHAYARSWSKETHDLVFVGQAYQDYRQPWAETAALNLQGRVHFLTDVEFIDLVALYGAADLFVLISLHEGFGLPVLEAMACGTPVIASRTTATGEITGNGGIQVDPTDTEAVADQIDVVLNDALLYKTWVERGRQRQSEFTWRRTALKTLDLYQRVFLCQ